MDLQYPIGKFAAKDSYSSDEIKNCIERIRSFPSKLDQAVKNFTSEQFDHPYREGSWTVRQLIHHIADSHLNAYIRVKWTLTEDCPVIKAYDEKLWATTGEVKIDPKISVALIHAHHAKWVELLNSLSPSDLGRVYIHPATQKAAKLEALIALYAWHGDHHLTHITNLKERMKW